MANCSPNIKFKVLPEKYISIYSQKYNSYGQNLKNDPVNDILYQKHATHTWKPFDGVSILRNSKRFASDTEYKSTEIT